MGIFTTISSNIWETLQAMAIIFSLGSITIFSSVVIAYKLFKWLGSKWLENQFQKQLEAYKGEQSRELAKLNHKINGLLDRTVRLHTKEFEVLPDIFGRLVEAHAWAANYVSPLQSYADVRRMNDDQLDEFLSGTEFMEVQKNEIKRAHLSQRDSTYTHIEDIYRYNAVIKMFRDFATHFQKGIIFIRPEIREDMQALEDLIYKAIQEKQFDLSHDIQPRSTVAYKRFESEATPLLEKIQKSVSNRLWESTITEV